MLKIIKYTRTLHCIIFFTFFISRAFAAEGIKDISGFYKCTGYDPFEMEHYKSNLSVKRTKSTYKFKWKIKDEVFVGTGILSKNRVSVSFKNPDDEDESGVIIYKMKKNDILQGKWTYNNEKEKGREECRKEQEIQNEAGLVQYFLNYTIKIA